MKIPNNFVFVFVPKEFPTRVVLCLVIKALLKYIHIALLSSFKWYYSVLFSTFWNHHHVLIPELFLLFYPKGNPVPLIVTPHFLRFIALGNRSTIISISMDLNVRTFHIFGITQYVAFCVWCLSFSIFQSSSMLSHTSVFHSCVRAKSLQSSPTLCNPMDWSPPGSSVHGIFQARILEWVTVAYSTLLLFMTKTFHHRDVSFFVHPFISSWIFCLFPLFEYYEHCTFMFKFECGCVLFPFFFSLWSLLWVTKKQAGKTAQTVVHRQLQLHFVLPKGI